MVKVSIIVPVHNSEVYLRRCLDSIVNQNLQEIEIILINDASTDDSLLIIQEYKERYPEKIVIIDLKENKGPGGARNEGIRAAKGEYIGFVDSDDTIEKEMYEELYRIAKEKNCDMVDCAFNNKHVNKLVLTTVIETWGNITLEKRKHLIAFPGFIWSKIVKRSILIDNNILFRENLTFEDMDFLPRVLMKINSIYASDMVLYNYERNIRSITSSCDEKIQIYDKMAALRQLVKDFKEINAYDDFRDELTFRIYNAYIYMIKYYAFALDPENVTYDKFKTLQDFFFELVDYDYHDNKYICSLNDKTVMYAELNNVDYKIIRDTCF